jgi:hypothetical protein
VKPGERFGWAGGLTLVLIVLAVASYVIAEDAATTAANEAREVSAEQLRGGCARAQLNRAWQRVRAVDVPSKDRAEFNEAISSSYFQITDCEATYATGYTGPPVFLDPAIDQCFVELTKRGYWVDREPFTTPSRLRSVCADLR